MREATAHQSIDQTSKAHFMVDSHHLALLDRFVARARRHAKNSGRQFTGVMIEIDLTRPVRVHAPDLEPLVLGLEPYVAGQATRSGSQRDARERGLAAVAGPPAGADVCLGCVSLDCHPRDMDSAIWETGCR